MIELDRVGYRYPGGRNALSEVSFRLEAGERAVLLGANGCGKSTLLKLTAGLLFATEGELRFRGTPVTERALADREWRRRFRGEIGLVFQNPEAMLFNPTVREEIAYGPRRLELSEADELAERWARRVGLEGEIDEAPFRLSGGEKQRLALACVLACSPRLLLLDEPTANLDPRASGWLVDFLHDQHDVATLISTQNLSLAAELGRRALVLGETGELLHDGPLSAALADTELLWRANLAHIHRHRADDGSEQRRVHVHRHWG
jgi:cobalt/nickel transport system ATP-binding protein